MSAKDCGNHGHSRKKLHRRLFGCCLALLMIIVLIILLIFLILRPTKPRFTLQDATVYQFNVTAPNFLSSNLQVTVASRNPNERIGIYYDRLDIYASYRNQQITLQTIIPPTYQGHKEINVWSPFVAGNGIPIAPYLAAVLSQDQSAGMVLVNIRINGRVRWKVGTWVSGKYRLAVNCPAYLTFGSKFSGVNVGPAVKFQFDRDCSTSV